MSAGLDVGGDRDEHPQRVQGEHAGTRPASSSRPRPRARPGRTPASAARDLAPIGRVPPERERAVDGAGRRSSGSEPAASRRGRARTARRRSSRRPATAERRGVEPARRRPSRPRSAGRRAAGRSISEIQAQASVSTRPAARPQHAGDVHDRRLDHRAGPCRAAGCLRIAATTGRIVVARALVERSSARCGGRGRRRRDEVAPELADEERRVGRVADAEAGGVLPAEVAASCRRSTLTPVVVALGS